MIRSALKEAERNKSKFGIDSKLYLRAQSMAQIEGMSRKELWELMTNVMENIIFGDDFPITQKKYNIKETINGQVGGKNGLNYTQRRLRWKYKVGAV
jgi:predicted DNA-binding transcriptional regulator AlpA